MKQKLTADQLLKRWKTRLGQVWSLGRHRVMCGDSRSADDVSKLMNGEQADLCFTSPPYDQQRTYRDDSSQAVKDWFSLMVGVFQNLPMNDSGQVLVNLGLVHRNCEVVPYWDPWIQQMRSNGWRRFAWYIWDKVTSMPGDWNGRLAPTFEFVFHFNRSAVKPVKTRETKCHGQMINGSTYRRKDGGLSRFNHNGRPIQQFAIPDSIVRVSPNSSGMNAYGHPAPFPVKFAEYFLKAWPGRIYEPFCGSGATIIAAENTGNTAYGMELSPAYLAITLQRFVDQTGQHPTQSL